MSVEPGDKVLYFSTTGFTVETNIGKFVVLNERDVIAVIEDEEMELEEEV
jgi:co-chaperonin GroES (HSP10)